MRAKVVIGANYGDEGKGLLTDYLVHKYNADVVVRFNGGAQAGHTVVTPGGRRHIFSHFSSGSFLGAATYLSKFFVINPILFFNEIGKLESLRLKPKVMIDPRCFVTTPYDMLLNHIAEKNRGNKKHGSCGIGFGETIQRNNIQDFSLSYEQLRYPQTVRYKLDLIRNVYFWQRCRELNVEPSENQIRLVQDENIFVRFLSDCDKMFKMCEFAYFNTLLRAKQVVFEGAQGLLLDQDYGDFPHVTRSNTGLKNVVEICEENYLHKLDVTYVTRCYLTRHGAGPLPGEVEKLQSVNVKDNTNIPNPFQDKLRFADLDLVQLDRGITFDLLYAKKIDTDVSIAITCLDQFIEKNDDIKFMEWFTRTIDINERLLSYGPTRATMKHYSVATQLV